MKMKYILDVNCKCPNYMQVILIESEIGQEVCAKYDFRNEGYSNDSYIQ